jgi:hypothetical protein
MTNKWLQDANGRMAGSLPSFGAPPKDSVTVNLTLSPGGEINQDKSEDNNRTCTTCGEDFHCEFDRFDPDICELCFEDSAAGEKPHS